MGRLDARKAIASLVVAATCKARQLLSFQSTIPSSQGNYESSVYIICSGVMALFKVDDEADEEICVQHCEVSGAPRQVIDRHLSPAQSRAAKH